MKGETSQVLHPSEGPIYYVKGSVKRPGSLMTCALAGPSVRAKGGEEEELRGSSYRSLGHVSELGQKGR